MHQNQFVYYVAVLLKLFKMKLNTLITKNTDTLITINFEHDIYPKWSIMSLQPPFETNFL